MLKMSLPFRAMTLTIVFMCLAIPGKIISINGRKAQVEYPGQIRLAMIGEITPKAGDFVMVQMGIIVKILTPEEAKSSVEAWSEVVKDNLRENNNTAS